MSIDESLPYRSPISKLLRFFLRSRDKWKAKCKAAKQENKSLKYRLTVMTENRDRWKAEARSLRKTPQTETAPVEAKIKKHAACPSRNRRCRHTRLDAAAAR